MSSKCCTKCGVSKRFDEFGKDKQKVDGRTSRCKSCLNAYYQSHKGDKEFIRKRKEYQQKLKKSGYYEHRTSTYCRRCYAKHRIERIQKHKLYYHEHPEYRMLNAARRRAKAGNLPFSLTSSDVRIPSRCPVLGTILMFGKGKCGPNSPSLDRIIPSKGYVPGNVIVVSNRVNTIKSNASPDELIAVGTFYKRLISREENL